MKKSGFSKLNKNEKIEWVLNNYFLDDKKSEEILRKYILDDFELQKIHDDFSENTISNFLLPLGISPNFKIDGRDYTIPMATEESSVVAAASKAAKYWYKRGGFKTKVISTKKTGQVHFKFDGKTENLIKFFKKNKKIFIDDCEKITVNMNKRGGGISSLTIIDKTDLIKDYYQLHAEFETVDSMGANFINSCLEQFAKTLRDKFFNDNLMNKNNLKIIMSILSNYVPDCKVIAEVECSIENLSDKEIVDSKEFANNFKNAVEIAEKDISRAVTHNKGIMNGVDAVVMATGNDFRAVEASIHAYASSGGNYKSLTHVKIDHNKFKYWIEIPVPVGTVGGLTNLHPLAKWSLKLLGKPKAKDLMRIIAVSGLAQNFAAIKSLITTGIQKGHMKMHLSNILSSLNASESERSELINFFNKNIVSYSLVKQKIDEIRNG